MPRLTSTFRSFQVVNLNVNMLAGQGYPAFYRVSGFWKYRVAPPLDCHIYRLLPWDSPIFKYLFPWGYQLQGNEIDMASHLYPLPYISQPPFRLTATVAAFPQMFYNPDYWQFEDWELKVSEGIPADVDLIDPDTLAPPPLLWDEIRASRLMGQQL